MRTPLLLCLLTGMLVGCGSSDTSDLQAFMDETRAKPRGSIEPLPQFRAYEPFTYAASALRSPFQAPVRI
ncbi:pilus assembly protein PilP, partial [Streptomyces sp. CHB19.2]|nr:pilus assembly protein PilP [Streptomyces sp. CHB19.2]